MSKTGFSGESGIKGILEGTPYFVVKKHLGKKEELKNCKIMELRSGVTEDYIRSNTSVLFAILQIFKWKKWYCNPKASRSDGIKVHCVCCTWLFLCHFAIAEIKGEPYCDVANASQKCLKIRQKNALSKSAYPCLSLELCVDTTGIFR